MNTNVAALLNDPYKLSNNSTSAFDSVFETDFNGRIDRNGLEFAIRQFCSDSGIPEPSKQQVDDSLKALKISTSGKYDKRQFSTLVKHLLEAGIII